MHTYWCRYFEPTKPEIPTRHIVTTWPTGMKGWMSGYGDSAKIWCARVDADSIDAAERVIRSCYGKSGYRIAIESIDEQPLGWRPSGGRFPE